MKKLLLSAIILLGLKAHSQSITELYNNREYKAIVKHEKDGDKLTADELYMIGYAFFQLENDEKSVEFYDKAIAKGLDTPGLHFYKGLSLRYMGRLDNALK